MTSSLQQMHKTLSFFALFFLVLTAVPAYADESTPPAVHQEREAFAKDFAQCVMAILYDQKKSYDDRKDVLRRAFSDSVDIDWIARFVLGKAWSNATDEQRSHYLALYRKYLTDTYVSNFAENPDKRISDIKVLNVNDGDDNMFTVYTQMKLADREILKVNYMIREQEKHYKVIDIAIENVSLINTHRAEFGEIANSGGVDSVIGKLEKLELAQATVQ